MKLPPVPVLHWTGQHDPYYRDHAEPCSSKETYDPADTQYKPITASMTILGESYTIVSPLIISDMCGNYLRLQQGHVEARAVHTHTLDSGVQVMIHCIIYYLALG